MGGMLIFVAVGCEKRLEIGFRNSNRPANAVNNEFAGCDPAVNRARGNIEPVSYGADRGELRLSLLTGVAHGALSPRDDDAGLRPDCSTWRAIEADIQSSISRCRERIRRATR